MPITFHRLFSLGLILLMAYFGGSLLISTFMSPEADDWLVDSRYVALTKSRYRPGSVTHFDLQALNPPRNTGFYLLVGEEDSYAAVFDRPGCLLEYRPELRALYSPCRQRTYPIVSILAGEYLEDIRLLPVTEQSGQIQVDISGTLPGRDWR